MAVQLITFVRLSFLFSFRIETAQNVSLRELESVDVCVVASCIAVNLRAMNR